jgi:hypothetical protein
MNHNVRMLFLCPLAALMLVTPQAEAARPGGVTVLLPPFVPVPAPQPFLYPVSPFDVIGFMQTATVDTPSDLFSGGTMELNGIKIVVPRNTILQMPAAAMTWQEMFSHAPAGYKALNQSGLALSDVPRPLTTYEVHVQGNRVINGSSDQYIAGLIFISQQSANAGQGYINCIDYKNSYIWVSSSLHASVPCTGARLRINTPNGRYGTPDPLADVRFTADEDNPTITSRSGYPMCLPRIDPAVGVDSLCPSWNRPRDPFTGAFSTIYTMPPATAGLPDAKGITHQAGYPSPAVTPDPFEQAPFEVGDSVTYAGSLVGDAPCVAGQPISSCQYISAHRINADLGIFTAPGTWPVYAVIGQFRIGVGGTPNPLFPQEALEKLFIDSFTTDNTQILDVYAVDVNPCTGQTTHRFYSSADPFGPPVAGLKGRARLSTVIGNFLPPTRDMAVASRSLTQGLPLDNVPVQLTANGLAAGRYQAPQFVFIFPENLVMGGPQIPLTFQEFPFLLNGTGGYIPFNSPPNTAAVNVGQLSPWPSLTAPAASCTTGQTLLQAPVANAGPPQSVGSGATVNLDASASIDPNVPALKLVYTWQQAAGPPVNLLNADAVNPQFVAPIVAAGTTATLTFQLAVCNGYTCGGLASVNVSVSPSAPAPSVKLSASVGGKPAVNVVNPSVVTLNASATLGGAACCGQITFAQTGLGGLPAVALARINNTTVTFTAPALPPGTPTPVILTFTATATASGQATTATVDVYLGADAITVVNLTYKLSKSQLKATVADDAPNGLATLTMTPLDSLGRAIGAAVPMTYDPTTGSYNILQSITNPIPAQVRFTSSFGAILIAPIQRIQ